MSTSISLRPPGQQWQTVGDVGPVRVVPSSVSLTVDEWGPLSASFLLVSRAEPIPALLAWTPVTIDIDGQRAWAGWVRTPTTTGRRVAVDCFGAQAILDGPLIELVPADSRLTAWDNALCVAGNWTTQGTQQTTQAGIVIGWPTSSTAVNSASSEFNGVTYAAGKCQVEAVRVTASFAASIGARFVVVGHDSLSVPSSGGHRLVDVPDSASGVFTGDTGGLFFRFISVGYTGMPGTIPNGTQVTIPALTVFDRAGYESSLLASDIARRYRALMPQLSSDESQIVATSQQVPHFERAGVDASAARAGLAEAALYDDARFGVDAYFRLVFAPRTVAAAVELGHECPPASESPEDPAGLVSAVDVTGKTSAGADYSRRFAITDDPIQPVRPAAASVANPDFAVNTASWTPTSNTTLVRGTISPPPGLSSWALIANPAGPGTFAWQSGESVAAAVVGPLLAGQAYRFELWAFDASTPAGGTVYKVPTVTLRLVDAGDPSALVEMTLRLAQSPSPPYAWQKYALTWVPRLDVTAAFVILWNQPLVWTFIDGARADYSIFPTFTGLRVWTCDTLLSRQRQERHGSIAVPVIPSDEIAQIVGISYLRSHSRLGYTGSRVCADGAARDARTGARLPAASLLGQCGRYARVADRLDPQLGGVGALAYMTGIVYDGQARKATVTLGQRYGATATLLQDIAP